MQITHRRFQINNHCRCLAGIFAVFLQRPSTRTHTCHHIALGKCGQNCVRFITTAEAFCIISSRFCRHITAHRIRQENRRALGIKAIDFAIIKIGFRHINVQCLIIRLNRVLHIHNLFKRTEFHRLTIHFRL